MDMDAATVLKRVPNGLKVEATIGSATSTTHAVATSISEDRVNTKYGTESGYEQSLFVVIGSDNLITAPAVGTKVTISGTEYRIIGKKSYRPSALLRLDLEEKYAN